MLLNEFGILDGVNQNDTPFKEVQVFPGNGRSPMKGMHQLRIIVPQSPGHARNRNIGGELPVWLRINDFVSCLHCSLSDKELMNSPSLCCGEIVKACGFDGGIEALLEALVFEAIAMNWHSLWIGSRFTKEQHLERGMVADPLAVQNDWISHGPGMARQGQQS